MTAIVKRGPSGWVLGPQVSGVTIDSRLIKPGHLFIAIEGSSFDGHQFIEDAVNRGAIAVIGERELASSIGVPYIRVESSRREAAEIAAQFFDNPSHHLNTIGVTGTNGKTSVVFWLTSVLRQWGKSAGMISSVVNDTIAEKIPPLLTTPESPDLQRYLSDMKKAGASHAVVEVSSHGIVQHRVTGMRFNMAIMTNITREHLDFHRTMEQYVEAKSSLFHHLDENSLGAILNSDDRYFMDVKKRITAPVATYGIESGEFRARIEHEGAWHTECAIYHHSFEFKTQINHPGRFNVYNILAVVAAATKLGVPSEFLAQAISNLPKVPGRMQVIGNPEVGPLVVVDYAHTPDGLSQSIEAVRRFTRQHLWLVFGARGGRDHGKRAEMGEIAATKADHIILTADSPNFENPQDIADNLAEGVRRINPHKLYGTELNRGQAIRLAVSRANRSDTVLITGRGPETHQHFGLERVYLVDSDIASEALRERQGKEDNHVPGIS